MIFFACLILAALLTIFNAFVPAPLSEFLVKKLTDILILCLGAIAGVLAEKHSADRHVKKMN
jgi:hypothetical protein